MKGGGEGTRNKKPSENHIIELKPREAGLEYKINIIHVKS